MNTNDIASITTQDIRNTIVNFLQQRLNNNSSYKTELNKLIKAEADNDLDVINDAKQKIKELEQRFSLENWMADALTKRISWLMIATHLSKGIHPSSKGANANYNTQEKSLPEYWVGSSTIPDLPYDATGSAAALDIFGLLNQKINDNVSLLQLITINHPALLVAFSDDNEKSALYLANLNKLLKDNWDDPQSSELNKQFYWPNNEDVHLSAESDQYRILIPLHPSSLCHVNYQKVQERFSEQNKLARDQRYKKNTDQQAYFTFHDLAVVKIGGSNAQNASQLIGSQVGRNFLLPSLPPKIGSNRPLRISKQQTTIFDIGLKYRCRHGFKALFDVVKSTNNTVAVRDKRKQEAFSHILAQLLNTAQQVQNTFPAGWSKDYQLDMNQKYWLDPHRGDIDGELTFAEQQQSNDWISEIEQQFALWVHAILTDEFKQYASYFDDAEITEWQREFSAAVKASQRKKEGIF